MQITEALQVFGFKSGLNVTDGTVKDRYRELSLKNHPDKGGKVEVMALINDAREALKRAIEKGYIADCQAADYDLFTLFSDAISAIRGLQDISIEACGSWLWVSGETKQHKDIFKKAGYRWARKKSMWYWRPADQKRKRRKVSWDMDKIRNKFGSETIAVPQQDVIA